VARPDLEPASWASPGSGYATRLAPDTSCRDIPIRTGVSVKHAARETVAGKDIILWGVTRTFIFFRLGMRGTVPPPQCMFLMRCLVKQKILLYGVVLN